MLSAICISQVHLYSGRNKIAAYSATVALCTTVGMPSDRVQHLVIKNKYAREHVIVASHGRSRNLFRQSDDLLSSHCKNNIQISNALGT